MVRYKHKVFLMEFFGILIYIVAILVILRLRHKQNHRIDVAKRNHSQDNPATTPKVTPLPLSKPESRTDGIEQVKARYKPVIFRNVVLNSNGNTPHTEIDEIIVSPYGIFCLELKAHCGIIFGDEKQKYWTQCKYNGKQRLYNPIFQNYKHTEALKMLLGNRLKAPIHPYVLFTGAYKVNVTSKYVFSNRSALDSAIRRHDHVIYNLDEYEAILKILTYASSKSKELIRTHITEVNAYLATLPA